MMCLYGHNCKDNVWAGEEERRKAQAGMVLTWTLLTALLVKQSILPRSLPTAHQADKLLRLL